MKKMTYSNQIRDIILKNADFALHVIDCYHIDRKHYDQIFWSSLDSLDEDRLFRIFVTNQPKPSELIDFEQVKLIVMLSRIQIITDYYRYVKLQDIVYDRHDSELFPEFNSYEDIKDIFIDIDLSNEMLDSTKEYKDASAYDKVLLSKALDKTDKEYLSKLNPFFIEEDNKYDINVDNEFIIKQINKWQNAYKEDINKSYQETANFLLNLNKINEKETLMLIEEMLNEINKNVFIQNNYPNDLCINLNGMIIDEEILTKIIKDYYETNIKKLKYGSDK